MSQSMNQQDIDKMCSKAVADRLARAMAGIKRATDNQPNRTEWSTRRQ